MHLGVYPEVMGSRLVRILLNLGLHIDDRTLSIAFD